MHFTHAWFQSINSGLAGDSILLCSRYLRLNLIQLRLKLTKRRLQLREMAVCRLQTHHGSIVLRPQLF
jgi:hypothetical protein